MLAARITWTPLAALLIASLLPSFLGCESEILRTAIRQTLEKTVKEIKASPTVKLQAYIEQKPWEGELSEEEVKRLAAIIEVGKPNMSSTKHMSNGTITYKSPDGTLKNISLLSLNRDEAGLCIDAANNLRGLSQADIDQLVKDVASRMSQ
jgi:hypothetical protein